MVLFPRDPSVVVWLRIKLLSCLEAFAQAEIVEQFYSSVLNEKTTAEKSVQL